MKRTQKKTQSTTRSAGTKKSGASRRSTASSSGSNRGLDPRSEAPKGRDATLILKEDHRIVAALFKRFEKLGDSKKNEKKKIVSEILKELSVHTAIEEQVLYPAAREMVKQSEDDVLEALEEHHIVKWTCSELEKLSPSDERYDAKVTVLKEMIEHHVEEEEEELFPLLKKKLGDVKLKEIGARLEAAKKTAPTRPHPRAPDTPPGNLLADSGAGLVDRALDSAKSLVKKVRGGAEDRLSRAKANGRSSMQHS